MGAGVSFVMQQAVNTEQRMTLGSAAWAGLISYFGGTVLYFDARLCYGRGVPPGCRDLRDELAVVERVWLSGKRSVSGPVQATARVASSGCRETPGANNVGR